MNPIALFFIFFFKLSFTYWAWGKALDKSASEKILFKNTQTVKSAKDIKQLLQDEERTDSALRMKKNQGEVIST